MRTILATILILSASLSTTANASNNPPVRQGLIKVEVTKMVQDFSGGKYRPGVTERACIKTIEAPVFDLREKKSVDYLSFPGVECQLMIEGKKTNLEIKGFVTIHNLKYFSNEEVAGAREIRIRTDVSTDSSPKQTLLHASKHFSFRGDSDPISAIMDGALKTSEEIRGCTPPLEGKDPAKCHRLFEGFAITAEVIDDPSK